jgi:cell division protein FtsI/penicillin-binding protein 2
VEDQAPDPVAAVRVDDVELTCLSTAIDVGGTDYGQALTAGCPHPFAELGTILGAEEIDAMLQAFEFTRPPEIRLETAPGQAALIGSTESDWQTAVIGQSDLTISPLQAARAFSAVLGDGYLPALRIVSAYKDINGRWLEVDSLGERKQVISSAVSDNLLDALTNSSGSFFGYSAIAITGPEEQQVSWFVGANLVDPDSVVLVLVVLEDSSHVKARAIALASQNW